MFLDLFFGMKVTRELQEIWSYSPHSQGNRIDKMEQEPDLCFQDTWIPGIPGTGLVIHVRQAVHFIGGGSLHLIQETIIIISYSRIVLLRTILENTCYNGWIFSGSNMFKYHTTLGTRQKYTGTQLLIMLITEQKNTQKPLVQMNYVEINMSVFIIVQ